MQNDKPESKLVKLVMPNATPAEIEDATRRWFSFLRTLNRIVEEREAKEKAEAATKPVLQDRGTSTSTDGYCGA